MVYRWYTYYVEKRGPQGSDNFWSSRLSALADCPVLGLLVFPVSGTPPPRYICDSVEHWCVKNTDTDFDISTFWAAATPKPLQLGHCLEHTTRAIPSVASRPNHLLVVASRPNHSLGVASIPNHSNSFDLEGLSVRPVEVQQPSSHYFKGFRSHKNNDFFENPYNICIKNKIL